MAEIKIISMGPGGLRYVTPEAMETLLGADILIGAEKFRELLPGFNIIVPEKIVGGSINLIKEYSENKIGILVTGDAGFYSLAKSVIKEFGKDSVKIIPGVSVVQLAFARLCEPWEDLTMISMHGRDPSEAQKVRGEDKFILLCDNKFTAKTAVKDLLDMTITHELTVMENLGMDTENIVSIETEDDTEALTGASLGVVTGIRR